MSAPTPTRRTVLRTAAWSVPAVTVATAAPAFAASSPEEPTYQTVTTAPLPFAAAGVTGSMGTWTVQVTAEVPIWLPAGTTVPPKPLSAVVTIPDAARAGIYNLGVRTVGGNAVAPYTISVTEETLTATLEIPSMSIPESGDMVIETSTVGEAFTMPSAGSYTITLEDITTNLTVDPPVLGVISETSVELERVDGNDYTLTTFTVG